VGLQQGDDVRAIIGRQQAPDRLCPESLQTCNGFVCLHDPSVSKESPEAGPSQWIVSPPAAGRDAQICAFRPGFFAYRCIHTGGSKHLYRYSV